MPLFTVTYHASGFAYKEEVEADGLEQAEAAAFARLDAPHLRVTAGERVLVLFTAQVGAIQVEPKAAPPLRLPTTPDQMPGERRGPPAPPRADDRPRGGPRGGHGRGGDSGGPGGRPGRRGDEEPPDRPGRRGGPGGPRGSGGPRR